VGLFDWLSGRRRQPTPPVEWQVRRAAGQLVVDDGRGATIEVPLSGARAVRIVALSGGQQHSALRSGWQVALAYADGDLAVGQPMADWRPARELARRVCEVAELPLDELTERMFSRVGQFTPPPTDGRS
jgi:hypothetical protein